MLTRKQKMMLHVVPARLGVDDVDRMVIQRNIGGFLSAADKTASHEGFAAVMAFYEGKAGGRLQGHTRGYWKAQHDRNETRGPNDRLLWRIRREAGPLGLGDGEINAFLASEHMSSGRHSDVNTASAYWLRRLLQALIEIRKRRAG